MSLQLDPGRHVGYESRKAYEKRCRNGFWTQFIVGPIVLDIGYRGGDATSLPIVEGAIGLEPNGYPGYFGMSLPFEDDSVDTIHASHVLEHLQKPHVHLEEWFRALRVGGTMILMVPHAYLYERRLTVPPSRWSPEHLFSCTPGSLMSLIENALPPNHWRLLRLRDVDDGYDYTLPPDIHPQGCLEIECVIGKIEPPTWKVEP